VLVSIANGTELMEAVITVDVLWHFDTDITVASIENQLIIQPLHDVKIVANAIVSDVADTTFDLYVCVYFVCREVFPIYGGGSGGRGEEIGGDSALAEGLATG
ncbi:hypothetical protein S245_071359, partial [Arachis hypogaea]